MPLPSVTFRSELDPVVRKELDQLDSELTEYLLQEHDDDGQHAHITAKSITVDGPVTITGGPVTINGAPIGGGSGVPAAHHATHEPGGSDPLVDAAWLGTGNVFTAANTFQSTLRAATGLHEYDRGVQMGDWIDVPFNAAHFAGTGGMTWTVAAGDIAANTHTLIGRTLVWTVLLGGTTVSGTPSNAVVLTIPGGFTPQRPAQLMGQINLVGVGWTTALVAVGGGSTITVYRLDAANYALGALYLAFQIVIPIV